MIVGVASGKGGTGKTTVAVNLALSVEEEVILLDCDVEAPNAHLFIRPNFDSTIPVTTMVPVVDENRCTYCGKCDDICRFKAIAVAGESILLFPELCHSCGGCVVICPENAVGESERVLGEIETGRLDRLHFVHGRLKIGEAMAPPLIKQVRKYQTPRQLNIIDAPPGTSCPVITSLKDVDFVILVTEPTPFGLHDLKLAAEVVKTLGIPAGIVINRSDIGDKNVDRYADEAGLPILLEIPFDKNIASAYSKGKTIIEAIPEYRQKFLSMHKKIQQIINEGV